MKTNEFEMIKSKNCKIIALLQWSKKNNVDVRKKLIKEISMINQYCKEQIGK